MQEYWFFASLTLKEVGERLADNLPLSELRFDYENVYEWFDATCTDGYLLNVSRKHTDEAPDPSEPFRIRVDGDWGMDDLGNRLSACLRTTVHFGKIAYLGGDDFQYEEMVRFEAGG